MTALSDYEIPYDENCPLDVRFVPLVNLLCRLCILTCCIFDSRVEHSVYALLRTRDMAISRYREFGIPVDWLLDTGVVGKVHLFLEFKEVDITKWQ